MEKESEGESNRKEDRRKGREREVEHGGTLQGVTFGANSVPSGCLHQFYRRFLNPDVGTDFTRSRLSLHRVEYLWHMSRGTVGQEMNKCGGCCFWNRRNLRIDSCKYYYILALLFCKFFANERNFVRVDL